MLDLYSSLINEGWTLKEIDEMDIFYYFDILEYKLRSQEKEEDDVYIDQVNWL